MAYSKASLVVVGYVAGAFCLDVLVAQACGIRKACSTGEVSQVICLQPQP